MGNHVKYIMFVIFTTLIQSCTDVREKKILALIQDWENREILFPVHCDFTILGKDTIDYGIRNDYKILTYVDSVGCISCKLQLREWKKYISEMDSLFDSSIQYLFFFSPEKKIDILRALQLSDFDYPICIDEEDSLNTLNNFPKIMSFHTFLLNKDNKVVAIGNPIHNPKIRELYVKLIRGDNMTQENDLKNHTTEVLLEKSSLSLDTFSWKEAQDTSFVLKNSGSHLLVIEGVDTSCGCISTSYPNKPVYPGDSVNLNVTYKADHSGHFDKTITVYCNAKSSPIVLKITGNAK